MNKWIPYQISTTLSKKVGGPLNLALILLASGYGIGKIIEHPFKNMKKRSEYSDNLITNEIITVKMPGINNDNLQFNIGDQYKILARTECGCLIEKIGDINSPYFVSQEFLDTIS